MRFTVIKENKNSILILTSIMALGAFLRVYHLNYQSLWYDELHSIIPTDPINSIRYIIEYAKTDQPPFFFIYLHTFFKFFDYNEFNGRLACALIGIAGIPAMYLLGREVKGNEAGFLAALLTAINYFHIYYSQELRFYGMAFLLSTLSFLFLIRIVKYRNLSNHIAYVLTTICLLYTHYYGMVIFATQAIIFFILAFQIKENKFIVSSLLSGIVVFLAFIPWVPTILQDLKITSFWIEMPKLIFPILYFKDYMGKDFFGLLIFSIFIFLFLKFVVKNLLKDKLLYLILIIWIISSYLIPYIKSLVGTPILHIRYTIVTLPAVILVLAIGWCTIKRVKLRYVIAFVLILSSSINLFFVRNYYRAINKGQFRESSEIVKARNVFDYPTYSSVSWHYNFYFRARKSKVSPLELPLTDFPKMFWLLQAQNTQHTMELEVNEIVKIGYKVVENHNLHEANAILFSRVQK